MSDGLEKDPLFDERIRVLREQRKKSSEARKAAAASGMAAAKHGEESDIESEVDQSSAGSEKAEVQYTSNSSRGDENIDSSRAHNINEMAKPIASDEKDEVTPRDEEPP